MTSPTFSIVVPAYNASRTVGAAIRSALSQTRGDLEVVVVNDGSTDETESIVRRFESEDARVSYAQHENRGPAETRNRAVALARGRFIVLLDSDDLLLPSYVDSVDAAFSRDPGAAVAVVDAWVIDDVTKRVVRKTALEHMGTPCPLPSSPTEMLSALIRGNFITVGATIRKDALVAVGGFDGRLAGAEDYELWMRLAANGFGFTRVPGVHAVYRVRPDSASTDEKGMAAAMAAVYEIVACEYPVDEAVARLARQRRAWVQRRLDLYLGRRPLLRLLRDTRRQLRRAWRLTRPGSRLYAEPPEAIAAALPELFVQEG